MTSMMTTTMTTTTMMMMDAGSVHNVRVVPMYIIYNISMPIQNEVYY